MQRLSLFVPAIFGLLGTHSVGAAPETVPSDSKVVARVESTLKTESTQIRQLAFDGDDRTFFESQEPPRTSDHFTLVLDRPVRLKSLSFVTGRPDGRDQLAEGRVEVSSDGQRFDLLAPITEGSAHAEGSGREIRAIRLQPTGEQKHPLVVRELTIASEPSVEVFKYPVEIVVDVSDAPELKQWAEETAGVCERWYPMINEMLKSDGYQPPRLIRMSLSGRYRGVAMASGDRITGSVRYFKAHPKDVGAMVHETTHVVQGYRRGNRPSWLVEGVSDYIRFFKYEPGHLGPINAETAHFDQSYRVSAAFLAYLTTTYDKDIVPKLNTLMREGKFKNDCFKEWTGKSLAELDTDWRETLRARRK